MEQMFLKLDFVTELSDTEIFIEMRLLTNK